MSLFESIILGIVQGLTEFLPISSTAHLRIIPALLGWNDPGAAFTAVIQCGTLVAVLIYFRRDIWQIAKAWVSETLRGKFCASHEGATGWMILMGTIPIVVLGVAFKKQIHDDFRSLYVIAAAMILVAIWLMVAEALARRGAARAIPERRLADVGFKDALSIGLAQALALIPGSSRSGTTIAAGLSRGLARDDAARFSFLLSLPAVFAAAVHELFEQRHELLGSSHDAANLLVCCIVSGIVGYASIAFLMTYLRRHTTWLFIIYRIALGLIILALVWRGLLDPLK